MLMLNKKNRGYVLCIYPNPLPQAGSDTGSIFN